MSQKQLATLMGVSDGAVSRWMSNSMPDQDRLAPLAAHLGVTADWLLGVPGTTAERLAESGRLHDAGKSGDEFQRGWERFIKLPKVAWAAAGQPLVRIDDQTAFYAFHRDWITRVRGKGLDENRLVVVQVDKGALGESMLPTIRPGALLVVDRGPHGQGWPDVRDLKPAGLYVVRPDEEGLTVKRIFRDGEHLLLMPDNPDRERFPPRLVPLKGRRLQHLIVGRVRWIGHEED